MYADFEVFTSFKEGRMRGFWKNPKIESAGCMLLSQHDRTNISGSVIPLSEYALLRADKQAIKIDSVPPLVTTPAAFSGALNIDRTFIASIS